MLLSADTITCFLIAHPYLQARFEKQETKLDGYHTRITTLENNIGDTDTKELTKKIEKIENNDGEVLMKLQNLESADVFLQEAHR